MYIAYSLVFTTHNTPPPFKKTHTQRHILGVLELKSPESGFSGDKYVLNGNAHRL